MELLSHNEGGSKKKGLARRAMNHSLSNSLNNLHVAGEKDDPNISTSPRRPSDSQLDHQTSPLRSLSRQGTTGVVTLLPNKMNVSEFSNQQQYTGERRTRGMQEDSLSLDSAGLSHIPCSDPDFIRNAKSNVRGTQSCPMGERKNSVCGSMQLEGRSTVVVTSKTLKVGKDALGSGVFKKVSPLLPRRTQLAPPQVKRSSSMTRFTEALSQVHNVCLFPAQSCSLAQLRGPHPSILSLATESPRHGYLL